VRFVYWLYAGAFTLLLVSSPVQNIRVPFLRWSSLIQLASSSVFALGMLFYRAPRERWRRLRHFWKIFALLGTAELLVGAWTETADAIRFDPTSLALMVLLDTLLIIFAIPAFWMNIRFALGYSAHQMWLSPNEAWRSAQAASNGESFDFAAALAASTFNVVSTGSRSRAIPWALLVAVVAASVGIGNLLFTIQNYKFAHAQPRVGVYAYKVKGDDEFWFADMQLDATATVMADAKIEMALPLKVINTSDYDATDVTIWLRATRKGTNLLSSNPIFTLEEYAGRQWLVTNVSHLSPHSSVKFPGIQLRTLKATRDVDVSWQIFAARMLPIEGNVKLKLEPTPVNQTRQP
jgi:hypothetical protein